MRDNIIAELLGYLSLLSPSGMRCRREWANGATLKRLAPADASNAISR